MKRIGLILLSCLLLSSCKIYEVVSIDYLEPATVNFPPSVRSVLVVNNTLQKDTESLNVVKKEADTENKQEFGTIECKTKLVTEELAQNIADANYFDEVLICDSALRKNDHFTRETKLSQQEVVELTRDFNVDMVVAVENAKMYVTRKSFYNPERSLPQTALDAILFSQVRLYVPVKKEPLVTLNNTDSVYWVLNSRTIPDKIIDEASVLIATLPIKYILPTWKTSDRYFYASGGVEMRDAAVFVKENSWDEALNLWLRVNQSSKKTSQLRSAYNIAVYYELNDDLEKAIEWAEKAKNIAEGKKKSVTAGNQSEDLNLINYYLVQLNKRLEDKKKLLMQMERFNPNP